jgi:N-acetylglucosamine kinase-like BadF-type ATPase
VELKSCWPEVSSWWIGTDSDTALACVSGSGLRVAVIAGTGSNCVGFDGTAVHKIGGYGHVLGKIISLYLQC